MDNSSLVNNRILAYLLIGVGVLFLLAQVEFGSGWLWVALVALAFLGGYVNQKSYGLLVTGSILAGLAVGLLIGTWPGLMISLGMGFLAIDRVEGRSSRWPRYTAAVLAGLGVLGWLLDSGFFGSIFFALVFIGLGLFLLSRRNPAPEPPREVFEPVGPAPSSMNREESAVPSSLPDMPPVTPDVPLSPPISPPVTPPLESATPIEDAGDALLRARLERWRRETAQAENRAAYLILTNDTLGQLVRTRPRTLEALENVKGIGPVKLEKYGQILLNLIAEAES